MRIVHLARYFYPHEGGIENFAKRICVKQLTDGHKVYVLTPKYSGFKAYEELSVGNNAVSNNVIGNNAVSTNTISNNAVDNTKHRGKYTSKLIIFRFPCLSILNEKLFFFMPKLFQLDPDMVVVHYPSPFIYFVVLFLKFFRRYKLRVIYHASPSSSRLISFLGSVFDKLFFHPTMWLCEQVVYSYPGLGPKTKNTSLLRIDVDKTLFKPMKIEKKHDIIFVGRLVRLKRVDWLLKAVAEVNPELRVLIVGDGPEMNNLKKLSQDLGLKNIVFAGQVRNKELPRYYNSANLFILPSSSEGYPVSILEAKACGLKVIASRISGIPTMLPKDSLFSSYDELVRLVRKLSLETIHHKK